MTTTIKNSILTAEIKHFGAELISLKTNQNKTRTDPTRGFSLIMLSIATSIDALAVGLSLAFLNINIWYPAVIIGVITSALSLVGITIGKGLGIRFGKKMEIAGGIVLIIIGLRILIVNL